MQLDGSKDIQGQKISSDAKVKELKTKSPIGFRKPNKKKVENIVAASESGSNEDQIEKRSPPWVKSKSPAKYGTKVGGTKDFNFRKTDCKNHS